MIWLILILIGITAVIVVVTLILDRVTRMDCELTRIFSIIGIGFIVLILGVIYAAEYCGVDQRYIEYHMLSETLSHYDESILQFERQQIIQKCIEFNAFLSSCKYWNATFFGDAIPDRVADLPYLDYNRILGSKP
jgi:hypothetical protein